MNFKFTQTIFIEDLHIVAKSVTRDKAPKPDGIVFKFYIFFYEIIWENFSKMVNVVFEVGHFPQGMNKGLITLLFKARGTKYFSNWKSITLLNVVYKIYVKVLQLKLQLAFMEVVDMDHATFLPQWYFLDNALLVHETMDWTKHTN